MTSDDFQQKLNDFFKWCHYLETHWMYRYGTGKWVGASFFPEYDIHYVPVVEENGQHWMLLEHGRQGYLWSYHDSPEAIYLCLLLEKMFPVTEVSWSLHK